MTLHPAIAAVRLPVRAALSGLVAGDVVVVACSGGADSLALASAAVFEGRKRALRVVGVTVDHGLQPGSAEQADRVVVQLATMGVDETLTARVEVERPRASAPRRPRGRRGTPSWRRSRPDCRPAWCCSVTPSTTRPRPSLLGLTRGSGGRSLQGMRPAFGVFARPLLGVRRDDTVTACQVEGLRFWDDPHNHDPGYTRVRVRDGCSRCWRPSSVPASPRRWRAPPTSCARTRRCSTSSTDGLLADARRDGGLDVDVLAAAPRPCAAGPSTAPRSRPAHLPPSLPAVTCSQVDKLLVGWRGQRWVDLPGPRRALRRDGLLVIEAP